MIYYDRSNVFEGIDVNKTKASKEYNIYHYWYFLDKGFKFQSYLCDGCHNISVMSMNPSNIAILNIRGVDYCCIINGISKNEAVNLLQNADLNEKSGSL